MVKVDSFISKTTLTDYEQVGFSIELNLADGHAYQECTDCQQKIVKRMSEIWHATEQQSILDTEESFIHCYGNLISSSGLSEVADSMILPTASNSIDLVASYLSHRNMKALLTYPTFDNLALLLHRRGVPIFPVTESELIDPIYLRKNLSKVDALFLVNPNNPTGTNLKEYEFIHIVEECKRANKIIIIDASFRLYYPQTWDSYKILNKTNSSYIIFEDTGKVFPTQDMKASLLSCSADHMFMLRELYNEIYLCVSKFTLGVLSEFFAEAFTGVSPLVNFHEIVALRRKFLRNKINEKHIDNNAKSSLIGVEWMRIPQFSLNDLDFVRKVQTLGVAVLPGRNFFWANVGSPETTNNFRISLMKPLGVFQQGVGILAEYLEHKGGGK
ncbi:aminotransferase class I/II-fold pyridoxal phosphate-dependent enzyme (plasmid) [Bartonella kosoyi]|uniref:Aminotransferase class I/II-fold pyridoxal phosphate-dependent enzyme n=1 Tax=Bartonella kosoyi TaxID=2133959 RepID=A0A5B9RWA8_9HYPH|nr:aminotransferase class I/II-fold pyridoxal phosphate-dependent enzyme [Bartonella kosoyi]QEG79287.1 aminotransferase class I/II-fold pyridoxal phosphate-dependent enzyme [Bartonella kosoyi]